VDWGYSQFDEECGELYLTFRLKEPSITKDF